MKFGQPDMTRAIIWKTRANQRGNFCLTQRKNLGVLKALIPYLAQIDMTEKKIGFKLDPKSNLLNQGKINRSITRPEQNQKT